MEAAAAARRAAAEATEALARSAGPYRLTSDVQEEKMAEMEKEVARKEKKARKWGARLEEAERAGAKLLARQGVVEAEGKDLAGRLAESRREARRLTNKERALEVELGEKRDQVALPVETQFPRTRVGTSYRVSNPKCCARYTSFGDMRCGVKLSH